MSEDEVQISHLQRRKIESRVLIPFIKALEKEIGVERTQRVVVRTIRELARGDGAAWADRFGTDIDALEQVAGLWAGGASLDIEMLDKTADSLSFNVRRCRYAEFYKELGLPELGYLIHCNRDFAMIDGFNPDLKLTRTQTVMEGATHCDFRFRKAAEAEE